jgi:hypothetical protein
LIENLNDVDDITINTLRVLDVLNRYRAKGDLSPSVSSILKEAFGKSKGHGASKNPEPTQSTTAAATTKEFNLNGNYNRDIHK